MHYYIVALWFYGNIKKILLDQTLIGCRCTVRSWWQQRLRCSKSKLFVLYCKWLFWIIYAVYPFEIERKTKVRGIRMSVRSARHNGHHHQIITRSVFCSDYRDKEFDFKGPARYTMHEKNIQLSTTKCLQLTRCK